MLLFAAGLLLNSCATMTKSQCLEADWQAKGKEDGSLGWPTSRIDLHAKACERAKVVPDREAWLAGHKVGALEYCQPDSAYEQGLAGRTYHNICPKDLHRIFVPVYLVGYELKRLRDIESKLERSVSSLESDIWNLKWKRDSGEIDAESARISIDALTTQLNSTRSAHEAADIAVSLYEERVARVGYMALAGLRVTLKLEKSE